jgi:D-glycero-D-manno-heptose 1,7-bisphosphate phosphatase
MNRALFLDRDGVINIDHGYVYKINEFEFINGIFETVQLAIFLGYIPIIVTNQAGIGRGYYTERQFLNTCDWMIEKFSDKKIPIRAVYYCPFHPDGLPPYNIVNHPDRKPNPGMLIRAARDHDIDLSKSVLIGDQFSDHLCAKAAGVPDIGAFGSANFQPPATAALPDHAAAQNWLRKISSDEPTSNR